MKKSKTKRIVLFLVIIIFIITCYYNRPYFIDLYKNYYPLITKNIVLEKNEYAKNIDYEYVQVTDDFFAKDKRHLLNIIYTIFDSGTTNFTFYCDKSYDNCSTDFEDIINNVSTLAEINSLVHPYNAYSNIYFSFNKKVINIKIIKKYSNEEIVNLNNKVSDIISENITPNMTDYEKIKVIHDYIINTSTYVRLNKAAEILINKKGNCNAYTDSMALFLEKFGLKNYRITSETHIWNFIYLNNNWLHLDVTFDDPITTNGQNILIYDMFLITTSKLKEKNDKSHIYDNTIYQEAK